MGWGPRADGSVSKVVSVTPAGLKSSLSEYGQLAVESHGRDGASSSP